MSVSAPSMGYRVAGFALGVCAYLIGLFHRSAPATIAGDLAAAFETSATALGLLAATYYWVYTAMQIPSGILADTLGPRRLLAGGGVVVAAGGALFALAPDFGVAAAGRVLVAFGSSVAFVACLKLVASWFDARLFATLTGIVVLVGNLSSAAAGGPFAWLLQTFGWREVIAALAVASAVHAIACWKLVAELRADPLHAAAAGAGTSWRSGLAGVLGNRATWPIFLANFGMGASFLAFATLWAVPYLADMHGLTRVAAASYVTVLLAVFAAGGLVLGTLSDRSRRRKPYYVGGAALLVAAWLPLLAGMPMGGAAGLLLCAAMGLGSAGVTMGWACAKEANAPRYSGIATGVANMGIFLGPAVMQPLVGWLLDLGGDASGRTYAAGDWQRALYAMAGAALFGFFNTLLVTDAGRRRALEEA